MRCCNATPSRALGLPFASGGIDHETHPRRSRMVEISLSGSGEGPGWATGRGYSTAGFRAILQVAIAADQVELRHHSWNPGRGAGCKGMGDRKPWATSGFPRATEGSRSVRSEEGLGTFHGGRVGSGAEMEALTA